MSESPDVFRFQLATSEPELARRIERLGATSTARGRDGQSPSAYADSVDEDVLASMSASLRAGDWRFVSYREKLVPKRHDTTPRQISIPAARDRVPLEIMTSALTGVAPSARRMPPQHVARRFIQAVRESGGSYVTRLDIRDFYPNVRHEAIEHELEKYVMVDALRRLIMRAVRTPTVPDGGRAADVERRDRGVPQGLPISNSIAELVMTEFDEHFRGDQDARLFRYADDMIFLTRRDRHQQMLQRVTAQLKSLGLSPHPFSQSGKSQWMRVQDGVDFLGYRINADGVSVRASGVHRLKRMVALSFARYRSESGSPNPQTRLNALSRLDWFLNLRITGCILDGQSRGWIQYYSLLDDFGLLRDLDHFVSTHAREHGVSTLFDRRSFVVTYRKWRGVHGTSLATYLTSISSPPIGSVRCWRKSSASPKHA